MLDVSLDYRNVKVSRNSASFLRDCKECQALIPHAHVYHRDSTVTTVHVLSERRFGHMHEMRVFESGLVTCTCEHGRHVPANKSVNCQYHLAQAHEQIAHLYEAVAVPEAGAFDGWDFDNAPFLEVAPVTPVREKSKSKLELLFSEA